MEKRLQEIFNDLEKLQSRKTAIETELRSTEDVDLGALDKEVDDINANIKTLTEEQRTIQSKLDIANKINANQTTEFRQLQKPKEEIQVESKFATLEYRKAFKDFVLRNTPIPTEYRVDANTLTTDIGDLIPDTVMNTIIEKLESTGMILPLITRTSIKGRVTVPTSAVKPVATWVSEGVTSDKQKKTLGESITFAYHKLRCAVSNSLEVETMALSAFENKFINNVIEAMVKAVEQAIVSGDGIGKPKGILAETPETGQNIDVANASTLEYQTLVGAEAALPLAYENGAVYCMTKKTFMAFIGMVDSQKQPIARVNYGINGKPERTLLGRQVILNDYMDSYIATVASDTIVAFLFNFKDYVLNTNYSMTIKKYEDNDTDDLVTKAIMLVDGKVMDKNSLVTITKTLA